MTIWGLSHECNIGVIFENQCNSHRLKKKNHMIITSVYAGKKHYPTVTHDKDDHDEEKTRKKEEEERLSTVVISVQFEGWGCLHLFIPGPSTGPSTKKSSIHILE